ncbi:hypothetical protein IV203_021777 [Nitzschia inconspicua]|uniref:Secreted protein n=1 Tax=Nitzschia inconspicua TaxID=303405 RepID=A0A9K3PG84_9STRA|nr:hypothetical protein IV203_021777 [Nitzschia inconspicua]
MKLFATVLPIASLFLAAPCALAKHKSSDDVEGTASIKSGDCKLECDWGANLDRRNLRVAQKGDIAMVTFERQHRTLGVELANIECTVTIGEEEFSKTIEFPSGWTQVTKEGDGADDYYGFSTSFTIEDLDGKTVAEGELEIETEVADVDDKDVLNYDDQDIAVTCL